MPSNTEREASAAPEGRPAKMLRFEGVQSSASILPLTTTAATTAAGESLATQEAKKENGCNNSNNNRRNSNSSSSSDNAAASPVKDDPDAASPRVSTSGTCNSSNCNKDEVEAALAEAEHRIWMVNTKVLYDVVMSVPLDWPSLTIQWLPGTTPGTSSTVKQRLLVGTHSSGEEPDSLVVMQVELPKGPVEDGQGNEYKERGDYDGFHFGLSSYKVKVVKRLPHPQESNCARYMPQRPSIIASCAVDGRILLYDLDATGACEGPVAHHSGNKGEATCLNWNPYREGLVASCGSGGTLAVHDAATALSKPKDESKTLFLAQRASGLNSCCWTEADIVLGVAEDSVVTVWDTRCDPMKPVAQVSCDGSAVNCVTVNQLKRDVFLCGSDDGMLRLFDRRRLASSVHQMEGHGQCKVSVVSFSQQKPCLALSGGYDKFVSLWDLDQIGADQDPEDAEDGPPELLFTHGGHRADMYDAAWNCDENFPQMVASVADDNKLHIWQPKASVFFDKESEGEQEEEDQSQLE